MNWLVYNPDVFGENDSATWGSRKLLERTGAVLLATVLERWLNPPSYERPFFIASDTPNCGTEPYARGQTGRGTQELLRPVDHQLLQPVGYRLIKGFAMLRDS